MSELPDIGTSTSKVAEAEQAVRFRFPVTWSNLLNPAALVRSSDKTPVVVPQNASSSTVQWSMVVPRLATPAASVGLLPAPPSTQSAQFAAPKYVVPKFEVSTGSASLTVKVLLSAAVALLVVPGWRNNGSAGARAVELESTLNERGWVRMPASGAASSKIERQLVLNSSSLGATDYRLDFTWRINPHGVAWIFRAKDNNNYYAVRIKPVEPESSRLLSVERSIMYHGIEKLRAPKVLALAGKDSNLHVRMDVAGPIFVLYLDGLAMSKWTDTRLTSGGVGFVEEGNKPPDVQSVRISSPAQ